MTGQEKRSDDDELQRLADAATPLPWEAIKWHGDRCHGDVEGDDCALLLVRSVSHGIVAETDTDPGEVAYIERSIKERGEADSAYIAAAANAVPALLAALAASRDETDAMRSQRDAYKNDRDWFDHGLRERTQELRAARAEVSQLRAKIDRLADAIETHAGPLTDARVHVGVATWEPLAAHGYTAAIGEVLDIVRAALAEPLGSTPEQPADRG